ncbi:MAG: 6-carboxytetrahydropterin synthase QueD [Pseudomonadota bacterium]
MIVELTKRYHFEAAHALTRAPEGHRCRQVHGHTYEVEVTLKGPVEPETGWLVDYGDITQAVKPVIELLDHRFLNEVEGLSQPTSEHLCAWLWARIAPALPYLSEICVRETPTSQCRYRGPRDA